MADTEAVTHTHTHTHTHKSLCEAPSEKNDKCGGGASSYSGTIDALRMEVIRLIIIIIIHMTCIELSGGFHLPILQPDVKLPTALMFCTNNLFTCRTCNRRKFYPHGDPSPVPVFL